jgi:hypothetical protein
MPKKIDLTGKTFGNWTVLSFDNTTFGTKHGRYICQCSCGTVKSVIAYSLLNGKSKSCGCEANKGIKGINQKHGMSRTRLFGIWENMRRRCNFGNIKSSKNYYYKGIRVCDEWNNDFIPFYKWAVNNGYSDNLTIDRIDNSKGYCPENCRWTTLQDQQRNRSVTLHIMHNGKLVCLADVCKELNLPYKRIHKRYSKLKKKGIEFTSSDICY